MNSPYLWTIAFSIGFMFCHVDVFAQGANAFGPSVIPNSGDKASNGNSAPPANDSPGDLSGTGDFPVKGEGGSDLGGATEGGGSSGGENIFGNSGAGSSSQKDSVSAFGNTPSSGATNAVGTKDAKENIPEVSVQTVNPSVNQPSATIPNSGPAMNSIPTNVPTTPAPSDVPLPSVQAPAPPAAQPPPAQKTVLEVVVPDKNSLPMPKPNDFSGAPPVPGTMRQMAEGEAPETYMVQPGDTLFDICDQLLDEKGYWPKLWSMNPEIKNPHFIFPNMKLRFYPGDDNTPPYLQVVTEDDVVPVDKGDLDEQELVSENVPANSDSIQKLVEPGRDAIEVIGPEQLTEDLNDMFIDSGGRFHSLESRVEVPGFIFAEEKEGHGKIVMGRRGETNLGIGDKVVIESAGSLQVGTLYSIIRRSREIEDPYTGDFIGYLYYFVGNIRTTKKLDDDLVSGVVQNIRMPVNPDDLVIDYISTLRNVPMDTQGIAKVDVDGSVVAFDFDHQTLGGERSFAFIDRGSQDGVAPGMYIGIYQTPSNLSSDFDDDDLPEDWQLAGIMRVVDVTSVGSVGYVMSNNSEIKIADRTKKM